MKLFLFVILLHLVAQSPTHATCETQPTLKLYSGYRSSPELRPSVKVVQEKLNEEINASLSVDGYFGTLTRNAVRTYQSMNGLSVDGIVGPNTWESLCDDGGNDSGGNPSDLLEPFQCDYGNWPSRFYTDQIVEPAFNSDGKSYHDLSVEIGLATGVHPALLTTHMVLESSMGTHDRAKECKSKGKTILTGCMWYPRCSKDCECSDWPVYSDKDQIQCTANTDKNASNLKGVYKERCNGYKGDPEKLWNCILCTYQGNFYKDIKTDDTDDRYFVKDGTCLYAENFKNLFCDWEAYFSYYEGI